MSSTKLLIGSLLLVGLFYSLAPLTAESEANQVVRRFGLFIGARQILVVLSRCGAHKLPAS